MIVKYWYTGHEPDGRAFHGIVHGSGTTERDCDTDARRRLALAEFTAIDLEPAEAQPGTLAPLIAQAQATAQSILQTPAGWEEVTA